MRQKVISKMFASAATITVLVFTVGAGHKFH